MSDYTKYKTKYIKEKNNIQFILFNPILVGERVWFHDMNNNKINFIDKLKKLGDVIIINPVYHNFMSYSKKTTGASYFYKSKDKKNIYFNIEDLSFDNYSKYIEEQVNPNKKFIAISLDQGSHIAKYFCNKNNDMCIALYVLIDRNFTKESYEKAFHSDMNYDFLKNIFKDSYKKYIIENLDNHTVHDLLDKIKDKKTDQDKKENYINALNGLCKGLIRRQYDKIKDMKVKTYIYSDIKTLTSDKLQDNIKINRDNMIFYYILDDHDFLIHSKKYIDDIYSSIKNNLN